MFPMTKKESSGVSCRVDTNANPEQLEIRPGGMLVQKRNSVSSQSSVSVPTIKVRVKCGSAYHEVSTCPHASFGELKKILWAPTGIHPEEQKLIYKKKERDSKGYVDIAGVKDGSKMVLVEDITNREKRCLQMLKSARIQKASNSIAQIRSEVDKFAGQIKALEASACTEEKITDGDLEQLIGELMTELVKLDGIVIDGDLGQQKRNQELRVQSYIKTLDVLKLSSCESSSKTQLQKQEQSNNAQVPLQQRQLGELKKQQQPLVTTKWETFD